MSEQLRSTREPTGSGSSWIGYRHEAVFYDGSQGFHDAILPFAESAIHSGEPMLVAVNEAKIESLRAGLGRDAGRVRFVDITTEGRNPARIIPLWQNFLDEHRGASAVRGVGEPIWAERSPDELVESERHEALLNLAFPGTVPFWLICPYDRASLPEGVVAEALRNHPFQSDPSGSRTSSAYRGQQRIADVSGPALPEPEPSISFDSLRFRDKQLDLVRAFVAERAHRYGLRDVATQELVLAADEIATNSIRHGGGAGTVRMWSEDGRVVCEIRDRGRISEPLVGRVQPKPEQTSGFGVWLANRLSDLVQIRTSESGTIVRLHKRGR